MRVRICIRGWLAILAVVGSVWSGPARAEERDPRIPPPRGFVNDFAHVLDAGTAQRLEALIGELKTKTGAEIAVVTVESTKPLAVADYAMQIAESWKPGAKGKSNGVVFVVAVKDHALHILTGYGIEGALPDGRVGEIRDQLITPRFRIGDYAGGIRAGTEAIAAIIAQEYQVTLSGVSAAPLARRPRPAGWPSVVGLIALLAVVILMTRTGLWPLLLLGGPGRGGFYGGSFGGGGFGGSGGGFGGFGGGGFGGGGAGGSW